MVSLAGETISCAALSSSAEWVKSTSQISFNSSGTRVSSSVINTLAIQRRRPKMWRTGKRKNSKSSLQRPPKRFSTLRVWWTFACPATPDTLNSSNTHRPAAAAVSPAVKSLIEFPPFRPFKMTPRPLDVLVKKTPVKQSPISK
ncbi:hypothetical protein ElyMa_001381800 [Elysia marginata]|uniref:Uncharacterized protein n=1 Tax=Elysia marginata TaxID=1093978 RepID=A0AAV4ISZ4_9GAST|nr:hypothetical protein ElyMa_001381800 [Elysia marginata]